MVNFQNPALGRTRTLQNVCFHATNSNGTSKARKHHTDCDVKISIVQEYGYRLNQIGSVAFEEWLNF